MSRANIGLSGRFKAGRSLDAVISDLEKVRVTGSKVGRVVDGGALDIQNSQEIGKHTIEGATSTEALLNSLYAINYLTDGGTNFNSERMEERREVIVVVRSW